MSFGENYPFFWFGRLWSGNLPSIDFGGTSYSATDLAFTDLLCRYMKFARTVKGYA